MHNCSSMRLSEYRIIMLTSRPPSHTPPKKNHYMQTPSRNDLSELQNPEQILIVNILFYPILYSILCLALITCCLYFGQAFSIITKHILMKLYIVLSPLKHLTASTTFNTDISTEILYQYRLIMK